MIVVTANRVSGKRVARTLGLVRGNTPCASHRQGHHGGDAQYRGRRGLGVHQAAG